MSPSASKKANPLYFTQQTKNVILKSLILIWYFNTTAYNLVLLWLLKFCKEQVEILQPVQLKVTAQNICWKKKRGWNKAVKENCRWNRWNIVVSPFVFMYLYPRKEDLNCVFRSHQVIGWLVRWLVSVKKFCGANQILRVWTSSMLYLTHLKSQSADICALGLTVALMWLYVGYLTFFWDKFSLPWRQVNR